MTKLSRRPISDEKFGHYINNLWSAFTLMDSKEEMRELFRDLFTHTEYKMFAKRLEIARCLLRGENYEEIIRQVAVSEKTVAAVSNILAIKGEGFRNAERKLAEIEKARLKKLGKRQDLLERKTRRKPTEETLLADLVLVGAKKLSQTITKVNKKSSVNKSLSL